MSAVKQSAYVITGGAGHNPPLDLPGPATPAAPDIAPSYSIPAKCVIRMRIFYRIITRKPQMILDAIFGGLS